MRTEAFFGLEVPEQVPGVPDEVLEPRSTWEDPAAYDEAARGLVARFHENFKKHEGEVEEKVAEAGPEAKGG